MPIPVLSLPISDLQYALNCMEIEELIAFSLCSKQTKNLAKSSNRTIKSGAEIDENIIRLDLFVFRLRWFKKKIRFSVREGSSIELHRGNGIKLLTKEGYTQSDWIAHLLSFSDSKVLDLKIKHVPSIAYLDTVRQLFPKCEILQIGENCSIEITKAAVSKFLSDVEGIDIESNSFNDENHISQFLNLNSKMLLLRNWENPHKVDLNDLSLANSAKLTISADITEKELNRFLKLWMKSNHTFFRPENMKFYLSREINSEEVLRRIKYQTVDHILQKRRLKREDGKELLISIGEKEVAFEFKG
ncbi:hypothetical protein B9Z55_021598 [Caenorhabditis nigoni]|uniref:F-box domain-containing protein n=1 Tax=Caenorhabditis nigoni TaxID=1611254 RepID=A0A2G5TSN8_9PELO|nr:hypothetical protein B9Z55_021598 [Caenorhabditis nigoni]